MLADIEREYSLGLDANAYAEYENRPAIIAQSIAAAPEPGELTSNPQQYYGRPLAVTEEIEEIQGANAFTLDEDQLIGGQELLVLRRTATPTNQPAIEDGETVAVTGVLRPFVDFSCADRTKNRQSSRLRREFINRRAGILPAQARYLPYGW